MADITPVRPTIAGVAPASIAANAGGDALVNPRGTAFVVVRNGGGGSINVTAAVQAGSRPGDNQFPPMTLTAAPVAVPAGAARMIGPFPAAYNDATGRVQLTYSGVTSVTVEGYDPNV